jgi:hypothetical protein
MKLITLLLGAALALPAQTTRPNIGNAEFEALQGHFDRTVAARHARLFDGIDSVAKWEQRTPQARAELVRMLWHNLKLPTAPPTATIVHREEHPAYTIENRVLESLPGHCSTSNL